MSERPELDELEGTTGWHSRIRYAFARRAAANRRVLDIACGNGFGTTILATNAQSVAGVDASAAAIEIARSRFSRPNVRYEHVPKPPLPFGDGEFDLVVCLETLEHLRREDQPAFIAEVRRVLSPRGTLVLSTPDRDVERAYELAAGASNPWHLHTPARAEIDAFLAPFGERRVFREADLVVTLVAGGRNDTDIDHGVRDVRNPVSVMNVCAADTSVLDPFETLDFGLRHESRLAEIDAALDTLPFGLRRVEGIPEQTLRIEAGLWRDTRPGTSGWWREQAAYAFAARLARGARVLDVGCRIGIGARRLAAHAATVTAVATSREALEVATALHATENARFIAMTGGANDRFDVVTCLSSPDASALRLAWESLADHGVLLASRPVEEAAARLEIPLTDLVATAILPFEGAPKATSREGEVPAVMPAARRLYALARNDAALDSVRDAPSLAFVRGDFQRQALACEVFCADHTLDYGGFGSDDRDEMIAARLADAERRLRKVEARLDVAYGHRPLFSLRALLNRLRRATRA